LTKEIDNADVPRNAKLMNIEDGNVSFYSMKEIPATFKQISEKIFDMSTAGKSDLIFSSDM